jgi:FkbM family methyltransferase
LQLSVGQRAKLLRQRFYAAFGINGEVAVGLEETPEGIFVQVDGRRIAVPSPLRWKLYRKGWEARLDRLEREYGVGRHFSLSPDSVVLDIGANAGEFAHVCARYGASVFCFEPDPAVFACLESNTRRLRNTEALADVVWNSDGEIEFALAPERADSSVFAEGPKVMKPCVMIETFVRDRAITRIDLIKCDAEGAEPEVLEGIGAAFSLVGGIALDTGPERRGERTNASCAEILRAHGFDTFDENIGTRCMTFGVRQKP